METDANRYSIGAKPMRTVERSMRVDANSCDVVQEPTHGDAKRRDIGAKPMRVDAVLYRFEVDAN